MRVFFGLILMVGVAMAGGAVYLAKNHISLYQNALAQERATKQETVPTVEIWVAKRPLKYGHKLSLRDVKKVTWPESAVPGGTFRVEDGLLFPEDDEGQCTVLRAMERNEAIMNIKVTQPGVDAGITTKLERGMRAFTILVDLASGVSGFLRPGDRVDVYWTGSGANGSGEVTRLIETGVVLMAIDQRSATDDNKIEVARSVTVSASPQQVAALAQAQSTGRLTLSLVGVQDDTVASAVEVNHETLLGLESKQANAAPAPKEICTVRNRRGAEVVNIPIPCTN